jgi:DNA polymerase-4
MNRIILHVDMNAFFAAVEQQSNPALRGKPIVVVGSAARTVILTASYEARAFGVKTGMRIFEARRCCPELISVPVSNRLYAHVSAEIMKILADYTPLVQVFSIDEAFLDISGSLGLFGAPQRIAYLIKSRIKTRFGLTCSVGIAPNKLLAKLASEMQKPDGLTVITPEMIPAILQNLPVGDLCGIGRQTSRQLALLGITTCGQLATFPREILRCKFGIIGDQLLRMAQGLDDSPVAAADEEEQVKSIGHSTTLAQDLSDRPAIQVVLLQLAEMVGRRSRRYALAGRTLTLTVRYADFTTFTRQQKQSRSLTLSVDIYHAALKILDAIVLEQPVRLLGISLSGWDEAGKQLSFFDGNEREVRMTAAMDSVNNKLGDFTVTFASLLDKIDKGSHVISPAWRPEGVRHIDMS